MGEQRDAIRRRTFKAGTIEFGGGGIDCIVKNLSETGAQLEVVSPLYIPTVSHCLSSATNSNSRVASFGSEKSAWASGSNKAASVGGLFHFVECRQLAHCAGRHTAATCLKREV